MRQAVELLLKRMESNPDEFVSSHPRQPRWDKNNSGLILTAILELGALEPFVTLVVL